MRGPRFKNIYFYVLNSQIQRVSEKVRHYLNNYLDKTKRNLKKQIGAIIYVLLINDCL